MTMLARTSGPRLACAALAGTLFVCSFACSKTDDAAKAASSSSATTAATTAAPKPAAPAANLPVKGPWDAVTITFSRLDPQDQSPYFKVQNTGAKKVKVLFIDFYGYDDAGKQVAHTQLSDNDDLEGGASDDVYTHPEPKAKTWEAVYHGIEFDGDAQPTMDYKRGPDQRPKGG
jgi:hypothetical protein